MKRLFTLLFISYQSLQIVGQDCDEFKIHLHSIDTSFYPGFTTDRFDSVFNANKAFVSYTIRELLAHPSDSCFIANRLLLKKFDQVACDSKKILLKHQLKNGKTCHINVQTTEFEENAHTFVTNKDSTQLLLIDDKFPFGGWTHIPKNQIKTITILIDSFLLTVPQNAYIDLFNLSMCEYSTFIRGIEAYESLNGEYIYLYIYGGNAADTFFCKLIFNQHKYLSRIVSEYVSLSLHHSFRESFIGF